MKIIILTPLNQIQIIDRAIKELKTGNLIIYPTETCYGLGADATNQQAINKLLRFKSRREGKAFSVAVADQAMAEQYVELNATAKNLYKNFLPGPLTVVSKMKGAKEPSPLERGPANLNMESSNLQEGVFPLAQGVASEFGTLGIRIPDHPFVLQLVRQFGKPITATSTNVSYQSPPYSLRQWQTQTPGKSQTLIDLWIDSGQLPKQAPSTVIDTTVDELTVLRQGSIQIQNADLEIITKSEEETRHFAKQVITRYQILDTRYCFILALQGPLGAGKTQFAKGIAKALGIKKTITSPTFTLVHEYSIPLTKNQKIHPKHNKGLDPIPDTLKPVFFHIDTWRMEKPEELLQIGLRDMTKPGNVILIEWAEKVVKLINKTVKQLNNKSKTQLNLETSKLGNLKTIVLWGDIEILDPTTRRFRFSKQP